MSVSELSLESFLPRFGLSEFRSGQREVIETVLSGKDCLCVMPTGGGKSLCYQLPSVARAGMTLVVSPLIALMQDQVQQLERLGLRATFINSTLDPAEQASRLDQMCAGAYDLVYVAAERFRSTRFIEAARSSRLQLLAVDEAHCISEWGHDFRPDYARLGRYRARLRNPPTIALTATATDAVRRDIIEQLDLDEPRVFITGFARPNLFYRVETQPSAKGKEQALLSFLKRSHKPGIVYAATRKRCEEVAQLIADQTRLRGGVYHAGLLPDERRRTQDAFMQGDLDVVVATNAFGMGIDKSDVRFVVHYNLPGTLEAYYQEAGRAGRDGKQSECLLLYHVGDRYVQEFFIESAYPPREMVAQVYEFLRRIDNDPIELTQQELKETLGLQISSEGIGACEQILEKAGALERLEPRQNMACVRIDGELPTLVDLLPRQAAGQRRVLQAIEALIGSRRNELVYFRPADLAERLELELPALNRHLRELKQLPMFDFVPPFRGRAIHIADRARPFGKLEIDFTSLEERKAKEFEKLERVISFARSTTCRQQVILRYFGQQDAGPCGHCDNCGGKRPTSSRGGGETVSDPATMETVRMVLSGVARANQRFGKHVIAQMLCGSRSAKMAKLRLERLSTYGLLSHLKQEDVAALIDALIVAGLVEQVEVGHQRPVLHLTERGLLVMRGQQTEVTITLPAGLAASLRGAGGAVEPAARAPRGTTADESPNRGDRSPRTASPAAAPNATPRVAPPAQRSAPPVVSSTPPSGPSSPGSRAVVNRGTPPPTAQPFTDASRDVAQPRTSPGQRDEAPRPAPAKAAPSSATVGSRGMTLTNPAAASDGPGNHYWTWRLLQAGFVPAECATIRGVDDDVILDHALRAVDAGMAVNVGWFLTPEQQQSLADVIGPGEPARIRPLLDRLPRELRYGHVQWFLKCRAVSQRPEETPHANGSPSDTGSPST